MREDDTAGQTGVVTISGAFVLAPGGCDSTRIFGGGEDDAEVNDLTRTTPLAAIGGVVPASAGKTAAGNDGEAGERALVFE